MLERLTRIERKQARSERKRIKAAKFSASFTHDELDTRPKIAIIPDLQKKPMLGVELGRLYVPKQPIHTESGSRFSYHMTWCGRFADCGGSWEWGELRQWSDDEWYSTLLPSMNSLEGLNWREIQNMSSDSGHRMHHDHDITDLCNSAVSRWIELGYEQFDTIFRFRLGNTKRAWGIELQGHFYLIWYERNHQIYPVS